MEVGFVGLGNMGFAMATNLARKGFRLTVHDLSPATVSRFLAQAPHARAGSLTEIATSPIVLTMLPGPAAVQHVYAELSRLGGIRRGALVVDSSTVDPMTARQVADKARSQQADAVDAPVSGGVGGAEQGTLTFMVGGPATAVERARPLLEAMGKKILHCGGPGTGQATKIANNLVLAVSMVGVSEAMNLGIKFGIDPKVLAGAINSSSGRCWSSDTYNPVPGVMENVPASRGYSGGFGSSLMKKDLWLALQAAQETKAPLPLASAAHQLYALMTSDPSAPEKDFSSVFEFLQGHK